jgi:hypothetical protein
LAVLAQDLEHSQEFGQAAKSKSEEVNKKRWQSRHAHLSFVVSVLSLEGSLQLIGIL